MPTPASRPADVVRMLRSRDTVMLGRAFIYALAANGEAGVANLLDLIAKEMRVAMTLTGAHRLRRSTAACWQRITAAG